jgi:hypothetical protein
LPEHLGQGTTIAFGFTIATASDQVPSPLTTLDIDYPANLGIGTSGLGLERLPWCSSREPHALRNAWNAIPWSSHTGLAHGCLAYP